MNGLALFAGVGGLDLGINLALPQSRAVCYVEGEAYAAAVLAKQMEEGRLHPAPIWSNVVTFDGKPWRGKVDFISGGFPCQPWSVAGKQKGIEDERWLWDDIERIIREVQPRFVFLENVPGLINGGLSPVLKSLAQIGFNAEWGTLRASDVGANHHRNRVFIFAYRSDSDIGRVEKLALSDIQWQKIPDDSRICSDVSNSDSSRSPESGQICKRANGPIAFSDGEKRSIIQHSNDQGRGECNPTAEPSELGFTYGRYDTVGRSPSWWSIEPGVGRVVDELAHRVDRLRACGNGVVPLQAGVAYSILINRAIERGCLNGA